MKRTKRWMATLAAGLLALGIVAGCSSVPAYEAGTRTSKAFTSEWMGLKFNLPGDMAMVSDEQLEQLMQISADVMYEDSKTGQQMVDYAKVAVVYEMMAQSDNDRSNVIVMAEKISNSMTEEKYIEASKSQISTQLTADYQVVKEGETRVLGGQDFKELTYAVDASKTLGYTLDQTMLVKKKGDRMIVIVFSYSGEEQLQKLMDGFSAL